MKSQNLRGGWGDGAGTWLLGGKAPGQWYLLRLPVSEKGLGSQDANLCRENPFYRDTGPLSPGDITRVDSTPLPCGTAVQKDKQGTHGQRSRAKGQATPESGLQKYWWPLAWPSQRAGGRVAQPDTQTPFNGFIATWSQPTEPHPAWWLPQFIPQQALLCWVQSTQQSRWWS